jgi:hypothetical protein
MATPPKPDKCNPVECTELAKSLTAKYIEGRYEKSLDYEIYVLSFTDIGLSWKAILETTLSNSGLFVVEYYALKDETNIRVYALTERVTTFQDDNDK